MFLFSLLLILFFYDNNFNSFFYLDKDEMIIYMYEIVLNYNYLNGKWIKVMIIYLVWNIDGDKDYKIIKNDRKGDGNEYVEIFFIE